MAEYYKEIYQFDKNKSCRVIVSLKEYKNFIYIDLREMLLKDGNQYPTKKGITIPLTKVGEMITAFESAEYIINTDLKKGETK